VIANSTPASYQVRAASADPELDAQQFLVIS
jgi:hypothetical protein